MGRNKKTTKEDVLNILEKNDIITVKEISEKCQVTCATIRSRLKELKLDNYIILPQLKYYKVNKKLESDKNQPLKKGLKLISNKSSELDEDDATVIINAIKWNSGRLQDIILIGKLSLSQVAQSIELLDLNEKQLNQLKKGWKTLSFVCDGLLIDKQAEKAQIME